MKKESNWEYPEPRKGLAGQWDKFIGPGATTAEQLIALLPALLGSSGIVAYAVVKDLNWDLTQYIFAFLVTFDIIGGVLTNATSAAKRWYHRKELTHSKHLGFIVIHIIQIVIVSWLFRDLDILYIGVVYFYLMISATIVTLVPLRMQRSTALLLVCGSFIISLYVLSPTPGFEWFIPVLFIKLLVSHLTIEEPYI